MDKTEITNEQYRRFVNYVADSLKYLAIYGGGLNQNEDTLRVDWNRASRINMKSRAVLERLNELNINLDLESFIMEACSRSDLFSDFSKKNKTLKLPNRMIKKSRGRGFENYLKKIIRHEVQNIHTIYYCCNLC